MALGLTGPATALTMQEAAAINMELAFRLCDVRGVEAWLNGLRAAGFVETVVHEGGPDVTHTFRAPADTVVVEVYYGNLPAECRIFSNHIGVTAVSQMLDRLIPQMRPGYIRGADTGPVDARTGRPVQCVFYDEPNNEIGQRIGVVSARDQSSQPCVEDGTSKLYSIPKV
ncbi:hypothetical protein PVW48_09320 [Dinoroseobacter sp. PD6]|jgi:hypothetical protein|uniref:hypothetical protein n=2 Tax=Dinoroseobacter TaxID=309512 RepID=UPI00237AA494|nr:hypothetical protein [Dinoroseobacter sp. PD6]MDD9716943.1 hypothetical protein [Dinoroseobacter sp. PD6]